MRHQVSGKKFSRNTKQRKALFLALLRGLVKNGEMVTTLAKAKSVRRLAEKLLTTARQKDVAARREVLKVLRDRDITNKLVDEIAPLFKNRPGGYLRIIKLNERLGDNAAMAKIEFVTKIQALKKVEAKAEPEKNEKEESVSEKKIQK